MGTIYAGQAAMNIGTSSNSLVNTVPAQLWALLWTGIIIIVASLFIWRMYKKVDKDTLPSTIQVVIESTIEAFDELMEGLTGGRLRRIYPYLFALLIMLLVGAYSTFLGFESPVSAWVLAVTLGLITFFGIAVTGIVTRGFWRYMFHKYVVDPMGVLSQFSPLISISIRLFASTFATTVLGYIFVIIFESIGMPVLSAVWPLFYMIYHWALKAGGSFLDTVQAFVFVMLTAMYWRIEIPDELEHKERVALRKQKKAAKNGKLALATAGNIGQIDDPRVEMYQKINKK